MQNDVVWEGIFKGLETRQVRRIEPIRPFFLPLKISKHPWITIFSFSCHSCHWFFLFLMVVQFIKQGSICTWSAKKKHCIFTLETRFGVCQRLMFSLSFLSIAGQLIWLLKSHIHLARQATPVSHLWNSNCRYLQDSVCQMPYGGIFLMYCFTCQWLLIQGLGKKKSAILVFYSP